MTSAAVDMVVSEIERLDLQGLRQFWGQRYGAPPALRSVPILRMLLAWRVQSEALGGLDGESRRMLARKGKVRAEGLDLGIGARLTRQWQGKSHEVVVEVDGFRWQGQHYRSLSAVATAIAGSKWNGPRFFGLREAS
ncbi:DUF2924 domain-containing protein [Novosphingobium aquiterrae]|uniref:DUF2924 domain-containing protein n=1 Tax=Novosphingobium aquiterrae TaxID=624388 RepID=A0ABV6PGF7_9SPHN